MYLHLVTGTETQTLMVATGSLDSSADHLCQVRVLSSSDMH